MTWIPEVSSASDQFAKNSEAWRKFRADSGRCLAEFVAGIRRKPGRDLAALWEAERERLAAWQDFHNRELGDPEFVKRQQEIVAALLWCAEQSVPAAVTQVKLTPPAAILPGWDEKERGGPGFREAWVTDCVRFLVAADADPPRGGSADGSPRTHDTAFAAVRPFPKEDEKATVYALTLDKLIPGSGLVYQAPWKALAGLVHWDFDQAMRWAGDAARGSALGTTIVAAHAESAAVATSADLRWSIEFALRGVRGGSASGEAARCWYSLLRNEAPESEVVALAQVAKSGELTGVTEAPRKIAALLLHSDALDTFCVVPEGEPITNLAGWEPTPPETAVAVARGSEREAREAEPAPEPLPAGWTRPLRLRRGERTIRILMP